VRSWTLNLAGLRVKSRSLSRIALARSPSEETEIITTDDLLDRNTRNLVVKFHVQVSSKRSRFNPCDLSVGFLARRHTNFDE
jgi:hypothetical protein